MIFGEGGVEGGASVAGCAEGDELSRVVEVGEFLEVVLDKLVDVDEEVIGGGLAGEGRERHSGLRESGDWGEYAREGERWSTQ